MSTKIKHRDDVNPERGQIQYGHVEFADPANKKYPIDTEEHILAAWRFIHQERNAEKYEDSDAETIKKNIRAAAKKHKIELSEG